MGLYPEYYNRLQMDGLIFGGKGLKTGWSLKCDFTVFVCGLKKNFPNPKGTRRFHRKISTGRRSIVCIAYLNIKHGNLQSYH